MVLTGLAFLIVTMLLGLSFALALTVPHVAPYLAPLLAGVGDHALTVGAGLVGIWIPAQSLAVLESTGYVAIAIAVMIYLWDIVRIYHTRKRAIIEAHNRSAVGAFGCLGLGMALAFGLFGTGRLESGSPVVVFLIMFGWLGGLGLTQLCKIIPFLTWLSRYGRHLGRGGVVPRVPDLVRERRSYPWFALYFLGGCWGRLSCSQAAGEAWACDCVLRW